MRVLLQRVTSGLVEVDHETVGQIGQGVVLLVGVGPEDDDQIVDKLAKKITGLRIFNDHTGRMNRSLIDVGGGALVVSQFTLYANSRKGLRPSFQGAAIPEIARPRIDRFCLRLNALGVKPVATGKFGAHMLVKIHNDGPVTIWMDSAESVAR